MYVLYVEHDDAPHNVFVFESLSKAERGLRAFALGFFGLMGEPIPATKDLVERLTEYNHYARIYACNDGGSEEIEPFVGDDFNTPDNDKADEVVSG